MSVTVYRISHRNVKKVVEESNIRRIRSNSSQFLLKETLDCYRTSQRNKIKCINSEYCHISIALYRISHRSVEEVAKKTNIRRRIRSQFSQKERLL